MAHVDDGPPPLLMVDDGDTTDDVIAAASRALDRDDLGVVHWAGPAGDLEAWRRVREAGFTFDGTRPASIPTAAGLVDGWFAHLSASDERSPRTTWHRPVVLESDRLRLRPHADHDLPRVVEACSDPRTRHWLPTMPDPYTLDAARAFVTQCRLDETLGRSVTWAVADGDTDEMLANVGLFRLDRGLCPSGGEIGYWAHPAARGRGIVTEAVGAVVDHAFGTADAGGLDRHRLQVGASWGNSASRRVAEANGFELRGRFRLDGILGDGTYDDGAWYDRLR